jgi:hypothetical protein
MIVDLAKARAALRLWPLRVFFVFKTSRRLGRAVALWWNFILVRREVGGGRSAFEVVLVLFCFASPGSRQPFVLLR